MKRNVGDKLPVSESYDRNAAVRPSEGPRCYLCGRLLNGDSGMWVALNGAERARFVKAGEEGAEGSVLVGSSCLRKYVPRESIITTGG